MEVAAPAAAAGTKRRTEAPEAQDTKRACIAAVSLDEPIDYSALDTLDEYEIGVPAGCSLAEARAGKKAALEMLEHCAVFEARPIDECDGVKRLRARLEPQQRGDEIKWRYVAQEFKCSSGWRSATIASRRPARLPP